MRKVIIALLGCIVVLLLAYSGYRGYELWKQSHWISLARSFAAKRDFRNEYLCLEQVLRTNRRNVEACRLMANLAETLHSSSALIWRKEVLALDPDSLEDRLALAQTAMFANDYTTAQDALAGVDAAGKTTSAYYNIAGELALAANKPDEAQADFAQVVRLDPTNPAPQLSLAVIELHRTNALDMAEARISLKRLSMDSPIPGVRAQAKRELIMDALRYKDNATALSLAQELADDPNALFSDNLLRLDVLNITKNGQYDSALASLESEAATNSDNLAQMTLWLIQRNLQSQALGWLQTLPANIQTNLPATLFAAQCRALTQDWSGLRRSLTKQNWGALDYARYAYLARALREQGLYEASKVEWDLALKAANDEDNSLTALFRLAAGWNWQDEAQQILWTIVNTYPQEKWAQGQLTQALYINGSTRPLMQLFNLEVSRDPSNLEAKNNLAMTAMLLHAQEMNPYDLAREVYQKDPTNAFYTCTYAFSLYLQGKSSQALQLMQQINPQHLEINSTAGYYGLILKAVGDNTQATSYLKRALRGQLLPEERALFQRALEGS